MRGWNGGTITNSYYTRKEGTGSVHGYQARTIAAGDGVTTLTVNKGDATTTYTVSGITVYSGKGIDFNDGTTTTFYGGSGQTVGLTLEAEPRTGYAFREYTASQGTLADQTATSANLTMPAANTTANDAVTVTAQYDALPTYNATFADASDPSNGWTISPTSGYEGQTVTVRYSGEHKVKSVTVKAKATTLAGLKAAINAADASELAALKTECVGKYVTSTGAIQSTSSGAVGIIAYISQTAVDNSFADSRVLVLATADASTSAAWCSQASTTCLATQYNSTTRTNDMAGYANTNVLVSTSPHNHGDNAASAAHGFATSRPTGASAWFLPSAGQWDNMIDAAGGYASLRTNVGLASDKYWSSTERDANYAWRYHFGEGAWDYANKTIGYYVRACFVY